MNFPPIYMKDFYKVGHIYQYPKGTNLIFNNFTPRTSRMNTDYAVLFGLRYFMQEYLINKFQFEVFDRTVAVCRQAGYEYFMEQALGIKQPFPHIADLYRKGFLPIEIYALPEGTKVPIGCPMLVMYNTQPEFFWLPQMLETILSCTLWGACTSATIASRFRSMLDDWAAKTSDNEAFVDFQAHDFSLRGMFGLEAGMLSGAAHLNYFKGTDNIPAMLFNNHYYNKPFTSGYSVPATEHSVMCAGGKDNELDTIKRLINEVYPNGIVSIVCDTWDFWHVVDDFLPALKEDILRRSGRVVVRPDSGDPTTILTGDNESRGLIEKLWDIFGGTINSKGYKELDTHIGAIYGDSITYDVANTICERLQQKGFATTNIIFGVGSYTYQYNTRDTLGFAMKATYCEVNGEGRNLSKEPVTDKGKKSHSGILKVIKDDSGHYQVKQNCTWDEFHAPDNELKLVFKDGRIL